MNCSDDKKRFYVISCEIMFREFCKIASDSRHIIDFEFMPKGLHNTPDEIRKEVQAAIDRISPKKYDYIILGYGLCSRGVAGIEARDIPLVIPRIHDCISLLLGSREKYNEEFNEHPGTYYYSPGWVERGWEDGRLEQYTPGQLERDRRFKEYCEKYGEDNAQFLIEQEDQWLVNYTRTTFINTGVGDVTQYREFTRELAEEHGWECTEIDGDNHLMEILLSGAWNEDEILFVKPGKKIMDSYDEKVLKTE